MGSWSLRPGNPAIGAKLAQSECEVARRVRRDRERLANDADAAGSTSRRDRVLVSKRRIRIDESSRHDKMKCHPISIFLAQGLQLVSGDSVELVGGHALRDDRIVVPRPNRPGAERIPILRGLALARIRSPRAGVPPLVQSRFSPSRADVVRSPDAGLESRAGLPSGPRASPSRSAGAPSRDGRPDAVRLALVRTGRVAARPSAGRSAAAGSAIGVARTAVGCVGHCANSLSFGGLDTRADSPALLDRRELNAKMATRDLLSTGPGWPSSQRSPAVSYSPTRSPLQYHRRRES